MDPRNEIWAQLHFALLNLLTQPHFCLLYLTMMWFYPMKYNHIIPLFEW